VTSMLIQEEIEKARALSEKIARFPEASNTARETMRLLLDTRGIITLDRINEEAMNIYLTNMLVGHESISDKNGPIHETLAPEIVSTWTENYLATLTDYYFANTFSEVLADLIIEYSRKHENKYAIIIEEVYQALKERMNVDDLYSFSEELMENAEHFVTDIKVSLIREYFSDHLNFIGIAKKYFTLGDLIEIKKKIFGKGKIGGKAAGIQLAKKILSLKENNGDDDLFSTICVPELYVLGSDLCYEFLIYNGLLRYRSFRYKEPGQMEADYKKLQDDFRKGKFHPRTRAYLLELLELLNGAPFVARSSSRLEDAIGFSFAGKYTSIFCPNRGSMEVQLENLEKAVREIYISMYNPAVLAYRDHNHLLDFEERIAVIIQKVHGRTVDDYFFPTMAGVAFSINPYCWSKKIKKEEGLMRIVMGFGSRAVERLGDDYARVVPLSSPTLRPEVGARDIKKYSQRLVDVMNLKENSFHSIPFSELSRHISDPFLTSMISLDRGDHLADPIGMMINDEPMILTFSRLLNTGKFTHLIRRILKKLERHIGGPVDIEFSVEPSFEDGHESFQINILQCRRFNWREDMKPARIPVNITEKNRIFQSTFGVPNGEILNIEYIIYVDPQHYDKVAKTEDKHAIARIVSHLNRLLSDKVFILMGPGRWGSNDVNLGVKVNYGDIYNTKMLIEIAYEKGGYTPEVSYGTHFFLDLIEARIAVMPLYPDRSDTHFNREFLMNNQNSLSELLPAFQDYEDVVKIIHVPRVTDGFLQIKMNEEEGIALAYLGSAERADRIQEDIVLLPI
jgi:hypothetical protein